MRSENSGILCKIIPVRIAVIAEASRCNADDLQVANDSSKAIWEGAGNVDPHYSRPSSLAGNDHCCLLGQASNCGPSICRSRSLPLPRTLWCFVTGEEAHEHHEEQCLLLNTFCCSMSGKLQLLMHPCPCSPPSLERTSLLIKDLEIHAAGASVGPMTGSC